MFSRWNWRWGIRYHFCPDWRNVCTESYSYWETNTQNSKYRIGLTHYFPHFWIDLYKFCFSHSCRFGGQPGSQDSAPERWRGTMLAWASASFPVCFMQVQWALGYQGRTILTSCGLFRKAEDNAVPLGYPVLLPPPLRSLHTQLADAIIWVSS